MANIRLACSLLKGMKLDMDKDMQPTMTIDTDGTKKWRLNGIYHRIDGPSIEYTKGRKCWFLCGKRHRTDGPAVIYTDGHKAWWLNDKEMLSNEWLDQNNELTEEEKVMLKLQYG